MRSTLRSCGRRVCVLFHFSRFARIFICVLVYSCRRCLNQRRLMPTKKRTSKCWRWRRVWKHVLSVERRSHSRNASNYRRVFRTCFGTELQQVDLVFFMLNTSVRARRCRRLPRRRNIWLTVVIDALPTENFDVLLTCSGCFILRAQRPAQSFAVVSIHTISSGRIYVNLCLWRI